MFVPEMPHELAKVFEFLTSWKNSGCVDVLFGSVSRAKAADGIEVFQGKAKRVDFTMAFGTGGVGSVPTPWDAGPTR